MKQWSYVLGLIILTGSLTACNTGKTPDNNTKTTASSGETGKSGLKIAYVNLDTLQNQLEFFKLKKEEFDKKEVSMRSELSRMEQNLQNEYIAFQKAAQAGTLSQSEGEAKQKRLGQLQQSLQEKQASLEEQYTKELNDFQEALKKRLDDYLEQYNQDKGYDFILSQGAGSQILLGNPALDITNDVIKGMNALPAADSSKK